MKRFLSEKDNLYKVALFIFAIVGFGVRLYCVYVMPYSCTCHDAGGFAYKESVSLQGHFGYIQHIWRYRSLPLGDPSKVMSFYNPPFFYFVQAVLWEILSVAGIFYDWEWFEFTQWIPTICSVCTSILICLILKELKVKGQPLFVMSILAFSHPIFIHQAINVTPDGMGMMFMVAAIYFTLLWDRKQDVKSIILIALSIGLGMLTKISAALVAPGIGIYFLWKLWSEKGRRKTLFFQYVIFGCICFPLGLYWSIRNYVLYKIPYDFVPRLSEQQVEQYLDPSKYSFWDRVGIPKLECFQKIHFDLIPDDQYNIWAEIFKSALVDETYLKLDTPFYTKMIYVLLWVSILLALLLNAMYVYVLVKPKTMDICAKMILATASIVIMLNFIKFCFDYPHTCSESFRYIAIMLLFPIVGGGVGWKYLNGKMGMVIKCVISGLMMVFGIGCLWIYCAQIV